MENGVDDKIISFFSQFTKKIYKKGKILLQSGENPNYIYYLKSGYILQTAVSEQGESVTIHIFEAGSFFPLSFALNQTPNTHDFEALIDSEVYLAPIEQVTSFLRENPDVLFQVAQRGFLGITGLAKRIESILFGNARSRVASILIYLSSHFGKEKNGIIKIKQRFTHQEIASLSGLTRERVSLELEQFTKEGIISMDKHLMRINNIEKLKEVI